MKVKKESFLARKLKGSSSDRKQKVDIKRKNAALGSNTSNISRLITVQPKTEQATQVNEENQGDCSIRNSMTNSIDGTIHAWTPSGILRQALTSYGATQKNEKVVVEKRHTLVKVSPSLVQPYDVKFPLPPSADSKTSDSSISSVYPSSVSERISTPTNMSFLSVPIPTFPVLPNYGETLPQSMETNQTESNLCELNNISSINNSQGEQTSVTPILKSSLNHLTSNMSPTSEEEFRSAHSTDNAETFKKCFDLSKEIPVSAENLGSFSCKDNSVTVVFSLASPHEMPVEFLTPHIQKLSPLTQLSEVKTNLNNLKVLEETSKTGTFMKSNSCHVATTVSPTSFNSELCSERSSPSQVDSLSSISSSVSVVKLDTSSNSSTDFGSRTHEMPPIKFHSDSSSSSDISSAILPSANDLTFHKADSQNSIDVIIPGTLFMSSTKNTVSVAVSNNPDCLAVVSSGQNISVYPVSAESKLSSGWSLPSTLSTVSSVSRPVTVLSSLSTPSDLPTTLTTTPSINAIPPNFNFTSSASVVTSLSLTNSVLTSTASTNPLDSGSYTIQSEILSQLSKAGMLPTISSSQVSSVLSALNNEHQVDALDTDTNSSAILHPQSLNLSSAVEMVSAVTQTEDDLNHTSLSCISVQREKNVCSRASDDTLIVQQVMNLLSNQPEPVSVGKIEQLGLGNINSTSVQNSSENLESILPSSEDSSGYPKIVAMVLNTATAEANSEIAEKHSSGKESPSILSSSRNNGKLNKTHVITVKDEISLDANKTKPNGNSCLIPIRAKNANTRLKKKQMTSKSLSGAVHTTKDSKSQKRVQIKDGKLISQSLDFIEDVYCFKCKFCPFLTLKEESANLHRQEHSPQYFNSNSQNRLELRCIGCANIFFSSTSLSVHLSDDHHVKPDDVMTIVKNAIKISMVQNYKNKKEDEKTVKSNKTCDYIVEEKLLRNEKRIILVENNIVNHKEELSEGQSKIRVRNLGSETLVRMEDDSEKYANNTSKLETIPQDDDLSGNENSLIIDFDSTIKQKQNSFTDIYYRVIDVEDPTNIIMICSNPIENIQSAKQEDEHAVLPAMKKRGRPRGARSEPWLNRAAKNGNEDPEKQLGHRCTVSLCGLRMHSKEKLDYHSRCHNGLEYVCPECSQPKPHWHGMSSHLWQCHSIDMELYSCNLCSYKTTSFSRLVNQHHHIHSNEKSFICDTCGKGFKNKKQLRNHKVIHITDNKGKSASKGECEVCGRTFNTKRMLRQHLNNVHHKLRPHLCSYCGYAAASVSSLKMHLRQHTGEKPFKCDECEYRTSDHNSLRRHKMRHSGTKPYKCPHCDYASIQSSTYKTHLKTKHAGLDEGLMFSCNDCSFRTIKEDNYISHLGEHKIGAIPSRNIRRNTSKKIHLNSEFEAEELPGDLEDADGNCIHDPSDNLVVNLGETLISDEDTQRHTSPILGITLHSDFEGEEITGDLEEQQEIKFKIHEEKSL